MNTGFGGVVDAEGGTGPFGTSDGFYASSATTSAWASQTAPQATLHQRVGHFGSGGQHGGESGGGGGGGPLPGDLEDYENEPPLLEELGVDFSHIRTKVTAVLMLSRPIDQSVMHDADMAGPLVFCLVLGICLLLVSGFDVDCERLEEKLKSGEREANTKAREKQTQKTVLT